MTDFSPGNLVVVTMGCVSVDLYPEQVGATLAQVRTFRKDLGGQPPLRRRRGLPLGSPAGCGHY